MPKIIKLPHIEDRDKSIESFTEAMQECQHFMIAMKSENGEVITGYFNVDFGMRAELIGHMNADLIDSMILANIGERY